MLDLGFEALTKAVDTSINTSTISRIWYCDWVVLGLMEQVCPVTDKELYKLYADAYQIDISDLDDTDLEDMAHMYKDQLYMFVAANVYNRIISIIDRWSAYRENPACMAFFKIPAQCKVPLTNLLMISKNTVGADYIPLFTAFIGSLNQSLRHRNTYTFDKPDVFELLNKEHYFAYRDMVKEAVDKFFTRREGDVFDVNKFNEGLKNLLTVVRSLVLLCIPGYDPFIQEPLEVFESKILPFLAPEDSYPQLRKAAMAHAICIHDENADKICFSDDSEPMTDPWRVIVTTLFQERIKE